MARGFQTTCADLSTFTVHAGEVLPAAGSTIVVGVSGGADSVALLDLLAADGRWRLVAYHLDHALREASAADAESVRGLGSSLAARGIACVAVIERADVAALARRWGCGLEAAGRRHRYARLREVARVHGAVAVATAHHRDDQAETVLMHLLRGAGAVGAAGMQAVRDLDGVPLVRPLLPYTRAQLRGYLESRSLSWRDDASNDDTRFRRNHIRARVLPLLEAAVPGTTEALLALGARRRGADAVVSSARDSDGDAGERWRAQLIALGIEPSRERIRRLVDLKVGAIGRRMRIGGWRFERAREGVRWQRGALQDPGPGAVAIPAPGAHARGAQTLTLEAATPPADPRAGVGEAWLDAAALRWPLCWRAWRTSDCWIPLGSPGHQSVRKYLADRKVPIARRHAIAVVCDAEGVVWVPGFSIAQRVRLVAGSAVCVHGWVGERVIDAPGPLASAT